MECGDQSYSERFEEPIYELSLVRSSKKIFPHHKMLLPPRFVSLSTFWFCRLGPDSRRQCNYLQVKGIDKREAAKRQRPDAWMTAIAGWICSAGTAIVHPSVRCI